jgi:hypothetical protein
MAKSPARIDPSRNSFPTSGDQNMTVRFRSLFRALAPLALAGLFLLASTPGAFAAPSGVLTLTATETGGPTLTVVDGGAGDADGSVNGSISLGTTTTPITFGDFSVLGSVSTSNSPGATLAQLVSSSLSVTNTTGALHTINLQISDKGFTSPFPATFGATASGTFNVDPNFSVMSVLGSTAHATAYADFTNTLFGTQHTVQDYSFAAGDVTTDSYANTVAHVIPGPQSSPYAMTVQLVFDVAGHNILSSRNDSITASPVPEPATLLSMAVGLPLLGLGAWVRRRRRSS